MDALEYSEVERLRDELENARKWIRKAVALQEKQASDLAALHQHHADEVEHAWAEAVCATATSTDQIRAGLDKWHISMTKVKLDNSKEDS